jgi:RNA polymerase sigma-70 factor, ECF subfamily
MGGDTRSDAELIEQFLDGHAVAFDSLVRRYQEPLYGFLRRLAGNDDLANDLFQDSFIKVMRALPEYKEAGKFRSWLFGVARNLAMDRLRRRTLERGIFRYSGADDEDMNRLEYGTIAPEEHPDAIVEREERAKLLHDAMEDLPESQREVLSLRYEADLTFRQIAEITGVSINTVVGRARYGIAALKKKLGTRLEEEFVQ